ncbi:AMP-binding protein [Bacillus alkalicellulosilyticus]|uniref:AMP-binding protein n=1 Tax=Alkalihalobacterium alkalicellulosilyticum TaxID=1912214 RepID=UPI00099891C8|nr:AMP-binding protein [Bacillus alkalicellulosilyticus]
MLNLFKKPKRQHSPSVETNHLIYMSNHVTKQDITHLHNALPKNVHFILLDGSEYKGNDKNVVGRKVTVFEGATPEHLRKIISIIEKGEPILLFPELRLSRLGRILKIYEEIAWVALQTKATIIPVNIKPITSNGSLINLSVLEAQPEVTIGEPFTLRTGQGEANRNLAASIIYRKLTSLYVDRFIKNEVNLFNELLEASKMYDNQRIMIKDPTNELSYKKLILTVQVLSGKLQGILTEPKVGVFLPSSIGQAVTLFSLFKIGITPAVLNFTMGPRTLLDCCETASIKKILTSRLFIEKGELHHIVETLTDNGYEIIYLEDVRAQITPKDKVVGLKNYASSQRAAVTDNEVILFTSGSENKPKGVILTHSQIYANIQQAMSVMDLNPKDKMLNPLPMFHSFGLTIGTFLPLLSGIALVIHPSPIQYKQIPEIIYQEDVTILLSTPTFLNGYGKNAHPFDLHTLRYAIAGAESVKEDTKEMFNNKFGIRILEGYGATEASPLISLNTPLYTKAKSVGKIIPGMEYKLEKVEGIVNGGSLLVKGPNIMKGYLIHGQGFVPQDGWYNTGDVVEIDEEGFVTITARLKRFAKIGGEMISLQAVEQIAMDTYDDIGFAAVSIPDKRKGEKIILFTSIKEADLKEIKRFVKEKKHSAIFLPSDLHYVEEIPLLGSGKTDYVSLERMAREL